MRTYNQLKEINTDNFNGIVAGAFFQLKKEGIREIREILVKNSPSNILFLDIFPDHSLSEIKTILSESERNLFLKQLGIKHYYSAAADEFHKLMQSFFNDFSEEKNNLHLLCGVSQTGVDPSFSSQFIYSSFENSRNFHWHKQLGYLYPLTGKVVYGNKIGRTLGFPTANLRPEDSDKIIPPMGVYAGWVKHRLNWYKTMINIGIRPTLDLENVTIEAHIFDFSQDIYEHNISIHFQTRIRDEMRFSSLDVLKKQLQKDRKTALHLSEGNGPGTIEDNFIII